MAIASLWAHPSHLKTFCQIQQFTTRVEENILRRMYTPYVYIKLFMNRIHTSLYMHVHA